VSSLQKQRIYFEQGKIKEAIAEGEKLIAAYPAEEKYVMGFAEMLSQKGNRAEAIRYLEKFIEQNPDAGNTKMLLAGLYRDNNEETKAQPLLLTLFGNKDVELSSKLLILGAYNAELNNSKAKNVKDPDKERFAELLFERLRKEHPEDANVHIVGGDLFLSIGKSKDAQKEYLEAIKSGEVNFEVWENLLYLENQLTLYDQMIIHSDQALELFPNHGMIYYFNGYAHLRKRNFSNAIASFEQAKRLSAANRSLMSEVNGLLGEAYYSEGNFEKAIKSFEEALTLEPENNTVLNNFSFYLAIRKQDLDRAERMSAQLIKNNPENPNYLDTHAWVLYSRGKYKEARKVIEKALSSGTATATHLEHYGDILFKLGETDAAVAQWEKARGLNANNEALNKKIANRKMYE
jgi:tetratricopeptide (TPR) repeat protein